MPRATARRAPKYCAADRQLAPAAVDQHGELDARRPAVVEQLVHRRAHRAAGVEHVVDEQEVAPSTSNGSVVRFVRASGPGA